MIDIHSHILPGIDDGAETVEDGVAIVRELAMQGVTDIIATPHFVDESIYTSSKKENTKLLNKVKRAVKAEGIDVKLYLGNEIYIFGKMDEYITSGVISTMANSQYILMELPMFEKYPNYEDIMQDLILKGYNVVLAHPERYVEVQNDFGMIERMVEMGVLLQCNTGSFIRQYGKHAEKIAVKLAKNRMIFALGSDMHHVRNGQEIELALKKLRKYYDEESLEEILVTNPQKMITGRRRTSGRKKV